MSRDSIVRMAREAGFEVIGQRVVSPVIEGSNLAWLLERFAALSAAAEREACAKVCEENGRLFADSGLIGVCIANAGAIRARGQDPMPLFDDWGLK